MEFLLNNLGDNTNDVISFLDYKSFINLINTQKTTEKNKQLINKKEYYNKYSIKYDKFNLAWKDNENHWYLVNSEEYFQKYYKLNWVWWFELKHTFKNLKGKYRFTLYFNKGNLEQINYLIIVNNKEILKTIQPLNLLNYPINTRIKLSTGYISVNLEDIINIYFYETTTLKNNMEIYYIEYI